MTADDPLAAALAAAGLAGVQPRGEPRRPGPRPTPARTRSRGPPRARAGPTAPPPASAPCPAPTRARPRPSVAGELPVLTALPELPARGVGADMIGRTAGLLVDIAVEVAAVRLPGHREGRAATSAGPSTSCAPTSTPSTRRSTRSARRG